MDSKDRLEPIVPALAVRKSPLEPAMADVSLPPASLGATSGSLNIGQTVLRVLSTHWWKILAIWVVLTVGLAYTIHVEVKPMYETVSLLRVEPAMRDLFGLGLNSGEVFNHFLQTQVQLIKSPSVLTAALTHPEVTRTTILREARDAESELRTRLQVMVIPGTYLIQVSMTTPHQEDAAVIVAAVVKAYLKVAEQWSDLKNKTQISVLERYQDELVVKLDKKKNEWLDLAKSANIDLVESPQAATGGSTLPVPTPNKISLEEYKRVREQQFQVSMDLIESEALVNVRQGEINARAAGVNPELLLQKRVEEAFHSDPEVMALLPQIESARRKNAELTRRTRIASDPSRGQAQRQLRDLEDRYRDLWEQKHDDLATSIRDLNSGKGSEDIRELMSQIGSMKVRKANYDRLLSKIGEQDRQQETDTVKIALVREEMASLRGMMESVLKRIEQLKFDSRGEARISLIDEARPKGLLVSDNRRKYWAMAPVGVFAVVLGLFLFLEIRSGRVADLDEVSRRVPVEVYALPALPGTRRTSDQKALRSNEAQLQEFLHSLDHLRVSLWYGKEATPGAGRCLAVTSAVGGEGKTTLSSHLAVCCAKAGISTLVIDADLRRAALSRMFEEEQSPGFSDVLKGDVSPEGALIALSDGGFHLLPAGTPGQHPGWLFREQRVGQVLDRYREMFDLVIIDTPPVLPVPDALSLGRWIDGAVLVIRYDQSRFALVDRARRRLISAGIPILKTVVNGVKSSRFSSDYGGGGYSSGYGYGNGYGERTPPASLSESSSDGFGESIVTAGPPESSTL